MSQHKPNPENELITLIDRFKPQVALALPKRLTPERFIRIVCTEVRKNPKLAFCDRASFFGAIIQCAQLGLEPGSVLGSAYLIPYGKECQLIIGYQGKIELAERFGGLSLDAKAVFEKDIFEYENGTNPKLIHKPYMGKEHPGAVIGAYAIARYTNGLIKIHVSPLHEIEKAKSFSKAKYKGSPWDLHYSEMAMKTAVHRLFKKIPKSPEMARVQELEESSEIGGQDLDNVYQQFREEHKLPEVQGMNDNPTVDAEIVTMQVIFDKENNEQATAALKIIHGMGIGSPECDMILDELHGQPESKLPNIAKSVLFRSE